MKLPVYLDNNATTALDPRVLDAMLPVFSEHYGNPASQTHSYGWAAEELVKIAREQVAALINASAEEIYFTSGATESNNLALMGLTRAKLKQTGKASLVSSVTEHSSVLDPLEELKKQQIAINLVGVNSEGLINTEEFNLAIKPDTTLASIMLTNNEIGVIQDIPTLSTICKNQQTIFHCDATQALGKIEVDVNKLGVDLLSLSAHKLYGPKGVGALYMRKKKPMINIEPLIFGGGHERGLRSGTLNVSGIVGLGKACELARTELESSAKRIAKLGETFYQLLQEKLGALKINGSTTSRIPGQFNFTFDGVASAKLVASTNHNIAFSNSSACLTIGARVPHVLSALGLPLKQQSESIRLCIGRFNTEEEIVFASEVLATAVRKIRKS